MTDTSTLSPCPHLESCPWCGCALYAVWRRANPRASCKTEGCFGRKMAVVNLDDPSDVAAWNRRAPAPAPTDAEIDAIADQHKASGYGTVWPHAFARAILAKWGAQPVAAPEGPVARIEGIDEYGPRLEWTQHWVDVGVGAKLYTASQVQAMLAAVPSGAAREPLTEEQMHKDLAALCKRIFNARIGKACSNCDGGTYQSDNNGYGQFHRCNKCRYVPMWGEDGRELGAPIAAAQKVNNA